MPASPSPSWRRRVGSLLAVLMLVGVATLTPSGASEATVSPTDDVEDEQAITGFGNATSCGNPECVAVSGTGSSDGRVAVSGTGDASSTCAFTYNCAAVSGTGDADGYVAVSGTGNARGDGYAVTVAGDAEGGETVNVLDPSLARMNEPTDRDPHIPTLVWAPLKTGFRAVVAWQTEEPTFGAITYSSNGAHPQTQRELTPRTQHVHIVTGLMPTSGFTFTASYTTLNGTTVTSDQHSFRLRNAMHAYDADAGAYTVNLVVLANERAVRFDAVEKGMDVFAERLWDATDGHVRLGKVIILYGDTDRPNTGLVTCGVLRFYKPNCNHLMDVVFAHENIPLALGATFRGGIADPISEIYMNDVYNGAATSTGMVLLHEFGHYGFWMDDLYESALTSAKGHCWDPEHDISVMDNNNRATEFDGPSVPCPNEGSIRGYVPSWTHLRRHYPMVPDRPNGPDPGPVGGDGGIYERHVFDFVGLSRI